MGGGREGRMRGGREGRRKERRQEEGRRLKGMERQTPMCGNG